jgi:hypothetical protein
MRRPREREEGTDERREGQGRGTREEDEDEDEGLMKRRGGRAKSDFFFSLQTRTWIRNR